MISLIIHQRNSAPFVFSKRKLGQQLRVKPKQRPTMAAISAHCTVTAAVPLAVTVSTLTFLVA